MVRIEYIQSLLTEYIQKQNDPGCQQALRTQMALLEKKAEEYKRKHQEIKSKISDLEALNTSQKIKHIDTLHDANQLKLLKVVEQYYSSLEPFKKFTCKNMNILETPDDMLPLMDMLELQTESLVFIQKLTKENPIIKTSGHLVEAKEFLRVAKASFYRVEKNVEFLDDEIQKIVLASFE